MVLAEENDEEETVKIRRFPISMHISEGQKYLHLSQFPLAISCFDLALAINPENIQALVGKAKCFTRVGRYHEARDIATEVLKLNPQCAEAHHIKGSAEYLYGDFERSFLTFWRGFKTRPNFQKLRLGYQTCRKAIDNSLDKERSSWFDKDDVIQVNRLMKSIRKTGDKVTVRSNPRHSKFERLLNSDMELVRTLLQDSNLISIRKSCRELYDYLGNRKKFWRMQNPDVTKKRIEDHSDWDEFQEMHDLIAKKCEKSLSDGDIRTCVNTGFEAIKYLQGLPECKGTFLVKARALHALGLAFMLKGEPSSALGYHFQELKIAEEFEAPELRSKAWRAIGDIYLNGQRFADALAAFNQCIHFLESDTEEAIILYKMAECHMNSGSTQRAAENAEKALDIAKKVKDYRLQFDITMLLAEIAIKNKRMKDAEALYYDVLTLAVENSDSRKEDVETLLEMFHEEFDVT